jgi:hypothetical protein
MREDLISNQSDLESFDQKIKKYQNNPILSKFLVRRTKKLTNLIKFEKFYIENLEAYLDSYAKLDKYGYLNNVGDFIGPLYIVESQYSEPLPLTGMPDIIFF